MFAKGKPIQSLPVAGNPAFVYSLIPYGVYALIGRVLMYGCLNLREMQASFFH